MSDKLNISYKLFLEAEDVSQIRILSSTSYVKNTIKNHRNPYISCAACDDESDMDDFVLRLYVEEQIEEEVCLNQEKAESFVDDFVELVSEIARLHSFLDMEGSFSISYGDETLAYNFASESGDDGCDFTI